jgi:serine/threonine protein kinase
MTIGPGTRVGPYEVTALVGEGTMGKVWRAHHAALKRDEALKVLPFDAKRFIFIRERFPPATRAPQEIHVIQNWFEELKRLAPSN